MSDQEKPEPPGGEHSQTLPRQQPERAGGREPQRGRRRHHQPQPQSPRRTEASINLDELHELVKLIAENGFTDFELEREGFRVRLRRELAPQIIAPSALTQTQSANAAPPTPSVTLPTSATTEAGEGLPTPKHPGAQAETAAAEDENLHIIPSPIVGTFYRSPSPTAEAFIRLGSHVEPDTVVCIIEAMKLMNEIQAETSGEVAKIYVENGQPVEYGQPLFGIKK